jgi:hypothetical protein
MSGVAAAASVPDGRGDETDLARAPHQILATLTDLRRDTSATELRDRIALVRCLRVELAAMKTLLTASYGRRAAAAEATGEPDQSG